MARRGVCADALIGCSPGEEYLVRRLRGGGQTDVCGGEACVVRPRIPVWLLVQAKRCGTSEADLLRCYPTLRAEDLAEAWA